MRLNAVDSWGVVHGIETKIKASRRIVHLQDDVGVLLGHRERQRAERERLGGAWSDPDLVFPSQLGSYLNPRNLLRAFDGLVRKAGVTRTGVHGLRHTHASLLIKNAIDIGVVSERLGHTNPGFMRNVYQYLYDEQRKQAALGLANLSQGAF